MGSKIIAIRTDASSDIGSGHVMRCLTLADALKKKGHQVIFIGRELSGHLLDLIQHKGFMTIRLTSTDNLLSQTLLTKFSAWLGANWQQDADEVVAYLKKQSVNLLIVDHYALDHQWEAQVKPYVDHVMVIDDLANRSHVCDMLLDSNLYDDQTKRYQHLIPKDCLCLFGEKYVLLRQSFFDAKKKRTITPSVKKALIFLSGGDANNITEKVIQSCMKVTHPIHYDVVVGASNPHKIQIQALCEKSISFHYHCQVDSMAQLMQEADVAIGAGGGATWERCFLGLPTFTLSLSDFDALFSLQFAKRGAIYYAGDANEISTDEIAKQFAQLVENTPQREELSKMASLLVDGQGVQRVVDQIEAW